MLRPLGDAKIGWDKVRWGLAMAPAKIKEGVRVSNFA